MTKKQRRTYVRKATKHLRRDEVRRSRDRDLNMLMAYCSVALAAITLLAVTGA